MTAGQDAQERRRAPRVPISLQVQKKAGQEFIGFGYAKDLSEMGLSIQGDAFDDDASLPKAGQPVELRFKLPKGKLYIRAQGLLSRVEEGTPPKVAVEFTDLDSDAREEIRAFVSSSST